MQVVEEQILRKNTSVFKDIWNNFTEFETFFYGLGFRG